MNSGHRVIGKDGKLTGCSGGLWQKEHLLDLEREHAAAKNRTVGAGSGCGP